MRHILLLAALLAALPASAQVPGIQVDHAWARATAPTATSGGVFLTLSNHGAPDRLVSAATPVAGTAELHETVDDNGIMKMRPVPALKLDTAQTVELRPGSYHIMLMGLHQQLKPGESFPVTLNFEKAGAMTVKVEIGMAGASGPAHTHP